MPDLEECFGSWPCTITRTLTICLWCDSHRWGFTVALSSAEASYFFVRARNWGEVKSKRAEPGENRNESARGTLGREKERREAASPFPSSSALALFFIFRVFRLPPLKEPLRRRESLLASLQPESSNMTRTSPTWINHTVRFVTNYDSLYCTVNSCSDCYAKGVR